MEAFLVGCYGAGGRGGPRTLVRGVLLPIVANYGQEERRRRRRKRRKSCQSIYERGRDGLLSICCQALCLLAASGRVHL